MPTHAKACPNAARRGSPPAGPGGNPNGRFAADFEYVAGSGDLDACNGRFGVTPEFPAGIHHDVLTEDFPRVPRLFRGTPHASFYAKGGNDLRGLHRHRDERGDEDFPGPPPDEFKPGPDRPRNNPPEPRP